MLTRFQTTNKLVAKTCGNSVIFSDFLQYHSMAPAFIPVFPRRGGAGGRILLFLCSIL